MFEAAIVTLLALLAVQLEQHVAGVARVVQMEPENHPALHGRPPVTALLKHSVRGQNEQDAGEDVEEEDGNGEAEEGR